MQLVEATEAEVGHPVEAWPTQILTIIFAFDPQMSFSLSQLEKVIAFFYGYNVPGNMTYQFFAACNNFTHHSAKDAFSYFYTKWALYPSLGKDVMYYNLDELKFKHVDESYVEAFNDVTPSLGYEATGFPSIARQILIHANQKEYVSIEED